MKSALSSLTSERERLKQCLDHELGPPTSPQVVNLKNTLAAVCEEEHTRTHAKAFSQEGLGIPPFFRLSHSSQMLCPPPLLVRHDTLMSLLVGLQAPGLMSAHLNKTTFSSHVSCGCSLPPRGFFYMFIVMQSARKCVGVW